MNAPLPAAGSGTVDASWPAGLEVPSPCIQVCRLDACGRHCEGCLRTLDEIEGWPKLGREERLRVWERVRLRRGKGGA